MYTSLCIYFYNVLYQFVYILWWHAFCLAFWLTFEPLIHVAQLRLLEGATFSSFASGCLEALSCPKTLGTGETNPWSSTTFVPFWPCLLLVSFLFIFVGLISLFVRLFLLVLLALLHSFRGRFPHLKRLYCYRSGGTLTQKLKPLNPSQGTSASEGSAASEGSFRIFSFFSFLLPSD